jgi:nucleoside-diphosphate-sugar epimerase
MTASMLILGFGYAGRAIAAEALRAGFTVSGTARDPATARVPEGATLLPFAQAEAAIRTATHLVITAGPGAGGDPVLARYRDEVAQAPGLCWVGYMSTTGVYGDRQGGWVDEIAAPAPAQERSLRRLEAEQAWRALLAPRGVALDLFRTAGIYGPGRNMLEEARQGTARRVIKPGHTFSRIHVEDIGRAVVAAALRPDGCRVLHLADDEPAEGAAVAVEAARLVGVPPPPGVPFETALASMSPMGRSFWAEDRKVASVRTQAVLGLRWRYPTYREGLAALHQAEQAGEGLVQ